nr:caspase family protein [Propionibacterium sp.]
MSRRALVVGIDGYPRRPLTTCGNDARAMAELLSRNHDGSRNWTIVELVARHAESPVVTREDLLRELGDLLSAPDDDVLFYFSGHAIRTPWGPELATQDGLLPGDGVSFSNLLTLINTSPATSITVILDSCNSGDLGTETPGDGFRLGHQDRAILRENVAILASTRADADSSAAGELSDFTGLLVDGLRGGAANRRGLVTALSLYSHAWTAMANGRTKPQFKANCAVLPVLRECRPWASPEAFRALGSLFPEPGTELVVEPCWLDETDARHDDYLLLTELFAARLVEVDDRWLEPAIEHGHPVRLSLVGRYYWWLFGREGG